MRRHNSSPEWEGLLNKIDQDLSYLKTEQERFEKRISEVSSEPIYPPKSYALREITPKTEIPVKALAVIFLVIMLSLGSFFVYKEINLTGFFAGQPNLESYTEKLNLNLTQSTEIPIILSHSGTLNSLRLSGYAIGNGSVKIYLKTPQKNYLILEKDYSEISSTNLVTGYETSEIIENLSKEAEINQTKNAITAKLDYGNNPTFDSDNNGIAIYSEGIDYDVKPSFSWDADYSKLCTRWKVENDETNLFCFGNTECCKFLNLEPLSDVWNQSFIIVYTQSGAMENNTVSAQVIYADISFEPENLKSDVFYSEWASLEGRFIEYVPPTPISYFFDECVETCALNLNESYSLLIELDNLNLYLSNISYAMEISEEIENIIPPNKTQGIARIGEPVTWTIYSNESSVLIEDGAQNIAISKIENGLEQNISGNNVAVIKYNEKKSLENYELEAQIEALSGIYSEIQSGQSAKNSQELVDVSTSILDKTRQLSQEPVEYVYNNNKTELIINETAQEYKITYQTEAPAAKEEVISSFNKKITISSPTHYTNILAYTDVNEYRKELIKLYRVTNDSKIDVTNEANLIDTNNNSLIDRIEWIVPSLSDATYEIEIVILNPVTYLRDGEKWIVQFTTAGTANLTINSTNAFWDEVLNDNAETSDEMQFIDLSCGNDSLNNNLLQITDINDNRYYYNSLSANSSIKIKSFFVENYSCNETSYFSNYMHKAGYAVLQFTFDGQSAFAYDPPQVSKIYKIWGNNSNRMWYKCTENGLDSQTTPESPTGYTEVTDYFSLLHNDSFTVSFSCGNLNYENSMYKFNVSQNASNITLLKIKWIGQSTLQGIVLYLYNHTNNNWVNVSYNDSLNENVTFFSTTDPNFINSSVNATSGVWLKLVSTIYHVSCPFIYSYNGSDYVMESEALSHYIANYHQGTTYQTLDNLKPVNNTYLIKVAEELDETSYIDQFNVYAIEHSSDTQVLADANGNIHTIKNKINPETEEWSYKGTWQYYTLEFNESVDKLVFKIRDSGISNSIWRNLIVNVLGNKFWTSEITHKFLPFLNYGVKLLIDRDIAAHVEYWNEKKWVDAGSVNAGGYWWERKLVFLPEEASKIRFRMHANFSYVKDVYADNSEDEKFTVKKLEMKYTVSSLTKKDKDYLKLKKGEYVDLQYSAINSSNKVSIVTEITGYYKINWRNYTPSWLQVILANIEFAKYEYIPEYVVKKAYKNYKPARTDENNFTFYEGSFGGNSGDKKTWVPSVHNTISVNYLELNVTYFQGNDTVPPVVTIIGIPDNSVYNLTSNGQLPQNIEFNYTFSEGNVTSNCTFIINNQINQTNRFVNGEDYFPMNFTWLGTNRTGFYNWSINCTDSSGNAGTGGIRTLRIKGMFNMIFISPTYANNSYVRINWSYVNLSITQIYPTDTVLINWNGTNVTLDSPALLGLWHFNNGTNDSSQYINNGNMSQGVNCSSEIPGYLGSACAFNGSNYINVSGTGSLNFNTSFTIEVWVMYYNNTNGGSGITRWNGILGKTGNFGPASRKGVQLSVATNSYYDAYFCYGSDCLSNCDLIFGAGNTQKNRWEHVAVTYDNVTLQGYLNGVPADSVSCEGSFQNTNYPYTIGGASNNGNGVYYNFNGSIDEVRIWNYSKSAAEIKAGYQAEVGRYYANFTHLVDGNYTYYAWANDTTGSINYTETRVLRLDAVKPTLTFVPPTPANNQRTDVDWMYINVSIDEPIDRFGIAFNGTNLTVYGNSLRLLLHMNGNEGDSSPYSNSVGGDSGWGEGYFGQSAVFYGTKSSFENCPDRYIYGYGGSLPTNDTTIEAWVTVAAPSPGLPMMYAEEDNGQKTRTFLSVNSENKFYFSVDNGSDYTLLPIPVTSTTVSSLNQWYHVAGVLNGTNLSIYVNGIFENSTLYNGTRAERYAFGLGDAQWACGLDAWNGSIDEVRVWDYGKSAAEIGAGYKAEVGRYYANFTHLVNSNYVFYAWANDSAGNYNYTETRTITANPFVLTFVPPTDVNNSFLSRNWTYVNVSITTLNTIDTAAIAWNGTNVTIYGKNLLGLWHFNNNTNDSSQYGNNGNASPGVNCSIQVPGYLGSACAFNGSGYVNVSGLGSLNFNTSFTIEGWVMYYNNTKGGDYYFNGLFGKTGSWDTGKKGIELSVSVSTNPFWLLHVCKSSDCLSDCFLFFNVGTTQKNRWEHVAATYDGQNIIGYLNGVQTESSLCSGSFTRDNYPYTIGGANNRQDGIYYNFNGTIDELRIWNYSKSSAEIKASYKTEVGRYYANFTNLGDGNYTYYAWANDTTGISNYTETRLFKVHTTKPTLTFVPPTDSNNADVRRDWTYVNVSIAETEGIDSFGIALNGVNATAYSENLLGLWHFNNDTNDSSQYANNGNMSPGVNCSTTVTGYLGSACYFNGSGYINASGSIYFNRSFTIEAWTWLTSPAEYYHPIASKSDFYEGEGDAYVQKDSFILYAFGWEGDNYGYEPSYYDLFMCPDGLCDLYFKSGIKEVKSVSQVVTDQWVHIAAVYNGSYIALFINGEFDNSASVGANPMYWASNLTLRIGGALYYGCPIGCTNYQNYWRGYLDEVRLWNYPKSAGEIRAGYNAELGRYYADFTHLSVGNYTYYAWANDSAGNYNYTETRNIIINPGDIYFVPPTDANNSFVHRNWSYVNLTPRFFYPLNTVAINWNGTNVTIYGKNLLGMWHFNNNTNDSSQYANNGNMSPGVNCSTEVPGYFGSACYFNGSDSFINVSGSGSLNISGRFTIEAWVKDSATAGNRAIVARASGAITKGSYWLGIRSSRFYVALWNSSGGLAGGTPDTELTSVLVPTAGTWYHVAAVYNGTNVSLYINGAFNVGMAQVGTGINTSDFPVVIGASGVPPASFWNGTIDELRIWNYSKSPAEIKAGYNAEIGRYYANFTHLVDGNYTYSAWANDTTGLFNYTETRFLRLDATPPVVNSLNNYINNSWTNYTSLTFGFNATDLNPGYCVLYTNISNMGPWNATATTAYNSSMNTNFSAVFCGWQQAILWNVYCNDSGGGGAWYPSNYTFGVDPYGPTISISGAPPGWNNTNQTATINCSDAFSGCNLSTRAYYFMSTTDSYCPYDYSLYTPTTANGDVNISSHQYVCGAAKDNVTNAGFTWYYGYVEFKVDKLAPGYSNSLTYPVNQTSQVVQFNTTWTDIGDSNLSSYIFEQNMSGTKTNSSKFSLSGAVNTSNASLFVTIKEGQGFYWKFYVNDTANNINYTMSYQVYGIANIIPNLSFVPPTPANFTFQNYNWTYINLSAQDNLALDTVGINWNGTNMTIFSPALLGLWHFNNNTNDSSQYRNDGNASPGVSCSSNVAGYLGSACSFNGSGYINVSGSGSLNFNTSFTIEAWTYLNSSLNNPTIVSKYYTSGSRAFIFHVWNNNYSLLMCPDSACASAVNVTSTANAPLQQWVHVAAVYNLTNITLFINGEFNRSVNYSSNMSMLPNIYLQIGSYNNNAGYWNGSLDELRIWNYSKSAAEIKAGYQAEVGRYYANFTHLADGNYTYYAWANDTIGNVNQTETRILIISGIAVVVNSLNNYLNNTLIGQRNLTFGFTATAVYAANCTLYHNATGTWQANVTTGYDSGVAKNFSLINLTDGRYLWNVYCNDSAGNAAWYQNNYTIIVDTIPPAISFVPPTDANNSLLNKNWTYVNVSIIEPNGVDTFGISWNGTNISVYGKSLLGLWHFNNNTNDSSQYDNDGNWSPGVNCSSNVAGYLGSACSFNGTGYINVSGGGSLNFSSSFTIEAWVMYHSTTLGGANKIQGIFGKLGNFGLASQKGTQLSVETDSYYDFYICKASNCGTPCALGAGQITGTQKDTWEHIAITYDGQSILTGYLNGVETSSTECAGYGSFLNNGSAPYSIGGASNDDDGVYYNFNGTIDELRIWNYSKSAAEILASYQAEFGRYYANFTNLQNGIYTYYAWANDTLGWTNNTETRLYQVNLFNVSLVPRTDADNSFLNRNWTYVNLSITSQWLPVDTAGIAWNGTNVTIYGRSLLGLWHLNNNTNDSSQYDNDGNWSPGVNCSSNVAGYLGSACYFNGSGYINISGSGPLNINSSFTIEAWVKPDTTDGAVHTIVTKSADAGAHTSFILRLANNRFQFAVMPYDTTGIIYIARSQTTATAGNWYHLAAKFNGSNSSIFINGILENSSAIGSYIGVYEQPTVPVVIGANPNAGALPAWYWNGTIDELRIWNYSKSEAEIKASYRAELGRYYANFTHLNDGNYTYYAWANDTIGNVNQTETRTLTIDGMLPVITLNNYPTGVYVNYTNLTFGFTATDANPAYCILYHNASGTWQVNQTTSYQSGVAKNFSVINLTDGRYSWNVYCNDSAGNIAYYQSNYTIIVDTLYPQISFVPPTDENNSWLSRNWTYVNLSVNDTNLDTVAIAWNGTNVTIYGKGLLGLWHFNNNNTNDSSIYRNDGNASRGVNCSNVTGYFGSACYFNGSGYVNVSSINLSQSFTIEAWVNPASTADGGIFGRNAYTDQGVQLESRGGGLQVAWIKSATGLGCTAGFGTVKVNEWTHVAITFDASTYVLMMYQNGTYASQDSCSDNPHESNSPYTIGHANTAITEAYFNGTIDELRVWNYSKSAAEIKASYNAEIGRYYANFTNLADGNYTYYAWVNDSVGHYNYTGTRLLQIDTTKPTLIFVPPTDANNSVVGRNWTYVNVSVQDASPIDTFGINWNGTNITVYGKRLLGLYHLEGNALDDSMYHRDGQDSSSGAKAGHFGMGDEFDAQDDYVDIGANTEALKCLNDTTIEAWAYSYDVSFNQAIYGSIPMYTTLGLYANGKFFFSIHNSTVLVNVTSTTIPNSNQWYYVAGVLNGTNLSIYVNGIFENSTNFTGHRLEPSDLFIGQSTNDWGTNYYWYGILDEVRIWNYSKSAVEIKAGYQAEFGRYRANFTYLPFGNYTYYAWANDSVGHYNYTETRILGVDEGIPVVNSLNNYPNGAYVNHNNLTFGFTATDANPANCTLYHNATGTWQANQTTVYQSGIAKNFSVINLTDGNYTWNVYCNDTAKNGAWYSSNYTLVVDTTYPQWWNNQTNATAATPKFNETIQLNITLTDNFGLAYYIFSWNNSGQFVNESPAAISGINVTISLNKTVNITRRPTIGWMFFFNDSAGNLNSTPIFTFKIINTPPTAPVLVSPDNNNITLNRTPTFIWNASYDLDNDTIIYILNITKASAGDGTCAQADIKNFSTTNNNYTLAVNEEIQCLITEGYYYNWTVTAYDGENYSSIVWRNISVAEYVSMRLINDTVVFGELQINNEKNTTTNNPYPLLMENNGNVFLNISVNATPLWLTQIGTSSFYKFMAGNTSEVHSFNYSKSVNTFTNMPLITAAIVGIADLNYSDATDTAELELEVTVPSAEYPGNKSSHITLEAKRSYIDR